VHDNEAAHVQPVACFIDYVMSQKFLWISKDSTSKYLSHSSRSEDTKIRHHVQRQRVNNRSEEGRHRYPDLRPALTATLLRPEEKRSLDYFTYKTAPEWSGWSDGDFWNVLALQTSQQDVAIAHGLVAIAAFHESSSSPLDTDHADWLRHFAMLQHDLALKCLASTQNLSHPLSLVSCVILASLESYEGRFRLLRSGAAIIDEALQSVRSESVRLLPNASTRVSSGVIALISRLQGRLCMMGDMPAALACSARHHRSLRLPQRHLPASPSSFLTLRAARDCLDAILVWGLDHVIEAHESTETSNDFGALLTRCLERWKAALKAMKSASTGNTKLLLQIAALNGMVLLLTSCSSNETVFDTYNPVFRQIMNLVAQISVPHAPQARVSFGVDDGLIDMIAFVGSRCRDSETRRSALHWLEARPRAEGERLSGETAQVVKAWIDLEERHRTSDSSLPPESQRRRLLSGERYHDHDLIKLTFVPYPYDNVSRGTADEVWIYTGRNGTDHSSRTGPEHMPVGRSDAVFGPGYAAFLDREQNKVHRLRSTAFHFPIPRV
jgi:hypothetical protein